jgi:TRAP-type C4-dicarboxylate transport system permease small subunit
MMSVLKFSKALMRGLDKISGLLLVFITVLGVFNVIMRYVFAQPITWVEEMSVLSMVWMVYLSQGMLESQNDQLRMTALYMLFGPRMRYLVNAVRTALTVFIFGYLLFFGCGVVANNYALKSTTQALGFPLWIAFLALPVTFVIIIIARTLDPLVKHAEEPSTVKSEEGGV